MKSIIHVNGQPLRKAEKIGDRYKPVFTVQTRQKIREGTRVDIGGPSVLRYDPEKPVREHSNGGLVIAWIETHAPVTVWHGDEEVK